MSFYIFLVGFLAYYGDMSLKVIFLSNNETGYNVGDTDDVIFMDGFFINLVGSLISTIDYLCNIFGSINEHISSYMAFLLIFLKNLYVY